MKTMLLVLAVLATFDACVPCKELPDCITGICYPSNWEDCCCPAGCLGVIVGMCYSAKDVNGLMFYSIFDANHKKLTEDTVVIDKTSVASQDQLDKIISTYGNQTLYMDAHIDIYGDASSLSTHRSWRHYKIN